MDFSTVEKHLQQEEQAGPTMTRAELAHRHAARAVLGEELNALHTAVNALYNRYHRLTKIPSLLHVEWANALLHFPNLVFFVIDSTGIRPESDIIRVHLSDIAGNPVFDRIIRPQRQPGQANTSYTGITSAQLSTSPTLTNIWDALEAALVGRYVLPTTTALLWPSSLPTCVVVLVIRSHNQQQHWTVPPGNEHCCKRWRKASRRFMQLHH